MNHHSNRKLFACSVVILAALGFAPDDKANQKDRDGLLGAWSIASFTVGGESIPGSVFEKQRMIFEKDRYIVKEGDNIVEEGTYTLDASKSPKTLDFKITKGNDEGKSQAGIYAIEGETFKVCLAFPGDAASERPKAFESKKESRTILVTMKKLKR